VSGERVLVLGFYDRQNTGDEQYKTTIPAFFGQRYQFDFVSVDDAAGKIEAQQERYAFVVCGGGDIVNPYFMTKIKRALARYTGPTYAISVGIPYDADVHFLDAFDRVIVRGKRDLALAQAYIGADNVAYMPDLGFTLPRPFRQAGRPRPSAMHVGICLAKPILAAHYETFAQPFADALSAFKRRHGDATFHFFTFNHNSGNPVECDASASRQIAALMQEDAAASVVFHDDIAGDVSRMRREMAEMRFVIGMRYHSMVFSLAMRVPLIACVSTKKAAQLMEDMEQDAAFVIRMDDADAPDAATLLETMIKRADSDGENADTPVPPSADVFASVRARLVETTAHSRFRHLLSTSRVMKMPMCADERAVDRCLRLLNTYHGATFVDEASVWREKRLALHGHDAVQVARILCFGVTGDFDSPCVWGLARDMAKDAFVLGDAIHYVHEHHVNLERVAMRRSSSDESYLPALRARSRAMLSIDPFVHATSRINASSVHRSGWSYVTSHLENLEAGRYGKAPELIVDTYVDRTFHWGHDTLLLAGLIPYRDAWMGFIHHTFDTTHSAYNNAVLFRNQAFRDSLATCKCLIVLSDYLAIQVRDALAEIGYAQVPVRVLTHPTESVGMNKKFTLTRFLRNPERKVIQVGAWLRNPYSIFALPSSLGFANSQGKVLSVAKAALKGHNMDGYYVSDEDFDAILRAIRDASPRANAYSSVVYTCVDDGVVGGGDDDKNDATTRNKYVAGLERVMENNHRSVQILGKQTNDAYDDLLSENIVFLDLVDCSAANTIMECVVRNTVLVVNRHPAVEEVLGASYPGFYANPLEAIDIIRDIQRIKACYLHLARLNKDRLRIETFMRDFMDIVKEIRG
jgi:hypothetical protein